MSTFKTLAERLEEVARRPSVAAEPVGPVKDDGPRPVSPEEIRAAGLLHAAPGNGGAPERAKRMAKLQQALGNSRLARLLGEKGASGMGGETARGTGHPEVPRRE